MRTAFVFDVNRCTGCQACQLACTIENDLDPERSWRAVSTFNERRHPDIPLFHLSLACNHCADPACMRACPALAYRVDAGSGAVLIDESACIGCGYCAWACPFDAPRFDHDRGLMTKCTFCNHRLADGLSPACAALCPTGALSVSRLPEEDLSQPLDGFPPSDLRPALKVVPLRRSVGAAAVTAADGKAGNPGPGAPMAAGAQAKITLKKEWPLAIFTWLAAVMFAMLVSFSFDASSARLLHAGLFAATALVAMLLGGAHLGRKARAWRIVLNVTGSPLSREIVSFGLFATLGGVTLLWAPRGAPIASIAIVVGLLALVAIEDVYRFTLRPMPALPHSANVVLTGTFLAAVLSVGASGASALAVALGVVKALLYTVRKYGLTRGGADWRPAVSVLRLGVGLAVPALLAALSWSHALLVACVLAGELVDRCELYEELDVMTPRLQMARVLAAQTGGFEGGAG